MEEIDDEDLLFIDSTIEAHYNSKQNLDIYLEDYWPSDVSTPVPWSSISENCSNVIVLDSSPSYHANVQRREENFSPTPIIRRTICRGRNAIDDETPFASPVDVTSKTSQRNKAKSRSSRLLRAKHIQSFLLDLEAAVSSEEDIDFDELGSSIDLDGDISGFIDDGTQPQMMTSSIMNGSQQNVGNQGSHHMLDFYRNSLCTQADSIFDTSRGRFGGNSRRYLVPKVALSFLEEKAALTNIIESIDVTSDSTVYDEDDLAALDCVIDAARSK